MPVFMSRYREHPRKLTASEKWRHWEGLRAWSQGCCHRVAGRSIPFLVEPYL